MHSAAAAAVTAAVSRALRTRVYMGMRGKFDSRTLPTYGANVDGLCCLSAFAVQMRWSPRDGLEFPIHADGVRFLILLGAFIYYFLSTIVMPTNKIVIL